MDYDYLVARSAFDQVLADFHDYDTYALAVEVAATQAALQNEHDFDDDDILNALEDSLEDYGLDLDTLRHAEP